MKNNSLFNIKTVITPQILINISLIGLLLLQIVSYARAEWVSDTNIWNDAVLLYKNTYSNKVMEAIRYGLLFLILAASLIMSKHKAKSWIFITVIAGFAAVYSAQAILEIGLSRAMYSGNLPVIYLLVVGFFIGQKKAVWDGVKKLLPLLLLAYVILFVYEFVDSNIRFGWVIYQNSSMMTYYAHMFWVSVAYIYTCITENKRKVFIFPLIIILFIGAIILRSRSWVIQAALLILVASFAMYRQKNKSMKSLISGIIIVIIVTVVLSVILGTFFGDFVDSLIEKGDNDSRSFQYIEMLEQVEPYKWLFGQGMTATYVSSLYGEYQYIDNAFFYLSFHYGVIFATAYFVPYLTSFLTCLQHRKNMNGWLFSALILFLWVASVNGLSVFNGIQLDIKSFIMPFLAGHIYKMAIDSSTKENKT